MGVIFWWLEMNWEVAIDLVEKSFGKLINNLGRAFAEKGRVRAHVCHKHEVSQIEADKKVTRVFLAFNRRQHILNEQHWV